MQPVRMTRPILDATPVWLRRFAKIVATATLFLIFAGAMVTSTGSGLAVPDWPNTYGQFMFAFPLKNMVGGIFYEHGHRMLAATVGFLTVLQAIWLQLRAPSRRLKILGWSAVGAVIAQGVLGGMAVLFLLPPTISVAHAGLAEIFLCLNVSIAFFASNWFRGLRKVERGNAPVSGTIALLLLVCGQILIGAIMRHLDAGLAIPDFPLSMGHIIPPFTSEKIVVNFAHRAGAAIVTFAIAAMYIRLLKFERWHPLRQIANMLILVIPTQVMLGAYTVWSGKQPVITSLHVMTGALTLAFTLLLALTAHTLGWRSQRAGAFLASEVAA